MVREIAIIDARPGAEGLFAEAFHDKGYYLLATTPGCLRVELFQSRETPTRFIGVNVWESEEAHLEHFRGTERYESYRALLGPLLASAPVVEHFEGIVTG
jgi:quinol monooxygenase YgiN